MSSTQAHLLSWLDLLNYVGTGNFHVICITAVHSLCCPPLVSGSFSSQRYSLAYFSSIIERHAAEEYCTLCKYIGTKEKKSFLTCGHHVGIDEPLKFPWCR